MFNKNLMLIVALMAMVGFMSMQGVYADQTVKPQQQFNKILLQPFYRGSVAQNINQSYTVSVQPPDSIDFVQSAILTFQPFYNPTVVFDVWVNGARCNNPNYTISTTFSGAGSDLIYFDCSNLITKSGIYDVIFKESNAGGSITGWLDVTYSNKKSPNMKISGTDYFLGELTEQKVFVELLDGSIVGSPINDGNCFIDVYDKDSIEVINNAPMVFTEEGLYHYDLSLTTLGVHPVIVACQYNFSESTKFAKNVKINKGNASGGLYKSTIGVVERSGATHTNATTQTAIIDGTASTVQSDFDAIKWLEINTTGTFTMINGTTVSFYIRADAAGDVGKTLFVTSLDGNTNYTTFVNPSTTYQFVNVTLGNISSPITSIFVHDGKGTAGNIGIRYDYIEVNTEISPLSIDSQNINLTYFFDNNYFLMFENHADQLDVEFNFTNVTTFVNTSASLLFEGQYSDPTEQLIFQLRNYTGGEWVTLSNNITFSTTDTDFNNFIQNITDFTYGTNVTARILSNITNAFNGEVKIDRFVFSIYTPTQNNFLQNVRGSGELHIIDPAVITNGVNFSVINEQLTQIQNQISTLNQSIISQIQNISFNATTNITILFQPNVSCLVNATFNITNQINNSILFSPNITVNFTENETFIFTPTFNQSFNVSFNGSILFQPNITVNFTEIENTTVNFSFTNQENISVCFNGSVLNNITIINNLSQIFNVTFNGTVINQINNTVNFSFNPTFNQSFNVSFNGTIIPTFNISFNPNITTNVNVSVNATAFVNESNIASSVWAFPIRTITSFNATLINSSVIIDPATIWNYANRSINSYCGDGRSVGSCTWEYFWRAGSVGAIQ